MGQETSGRWLPRFQIFELDVVRRACIWNRAAHHLSRLRDKGHNKIYFIDTIGTVKVMHAKKSNNAKRDGKECYIMN